MRLNVQGHITFIDTKDSPDNQNFQIDYQNTLELDEFFDSEHKLFTLKEIENLMQSTSHYHKLYALRILSSTVARPENLEHVFKTIMNDKHT